MGETSPKRTLIDKLSKKYRIEPIRGSDVVAVNSKAILYLRECKNLGTTKKLLGKFWFGITQSEYSKYSDSNLFIVCVCVFDSEHADCLVFPFEEFEKIKNEIALRSGQWKFNILKSAEHRYFLQIPNMEDLEVTEFVNYFDFSPVQFRKTYAPQVGGLIPKELKEEKLAIQKPPLPLAEELLTASKDSSNPKNFEIALEKLFAELGFRCKRIGGSGETDILVTEPIRFIVEGKSTKADTKSAINFTRIKRHMKESNANFMVIASVGFDPAVGRDAELENAALVDIQSLIAMLRIHERHTLSPFDYAEVLRQPGVITTARLNILTQKAEEQERKIQKVLIIIDNLDFSFRNIDELRGRIDLFCDQRRLPKLEKLEIANLLSLMSDDIFGIIMHKGEQFSLRFTQSKAKDRIKTTLRMLSSFQLAD
jgi:hypothetical protein